MSFCCWHSHLGNACQEFLSPCHGKHVCTDQIPVYTFTERIGIGVRTCANSKGQIPSSGQLQGVLNPQCCIIQENEPNALPAELFWSHDFSQLTLSQPCKAVIARLHRHRTLSLTERSRHFSTSTSKETGRKKTIDTRHTLTQFGDWSGLSKPLSSTCTQGTVV